MDGVARAEGLYSRRTFDSSGEVSLDRYRDARRGCETVISDITWIKHRV
jgi:hypothetical protein